jgi:3'-phosphoadenosine 5'-phosphosulfate sulfotransferase (PAPS reductase)/FAD synthetase
MTHPLDAIVSPVTDRRLAGITSVCSAHPFVIEAALAQAGGDGLPVLIEQAVRDAAELDGASAQELLRWTDENYGGNYIVASNMQDAVLIDLAAKVRPGVDVLFLDTGYHFVETIGTRDAVEAVYDINVVNVTPENSVAKQDELFGKDLFAREPNECCRMRKVEPLSKSLRGYSAWPTGIRRRWSRPVCLVRIPRCCRC